MNIFITGAAGYIGGSIAHVLLGARHAIRGLVRNPEKLERLATLGVTPVLGDLDDHDLLLHEAKQADALSTPPAATIALRWKRCWKDCAVPASHSCTPAVPAG